MIDRVLGLGELFMDKDGNNQSHHYAAFFYIGYYFGSVPGFFANAVRDWENMGDILLGTIAAEQGEQFSHGIGDIMDYINIVWWCVK